jgi:hypothetical protein
MEHVVFFPGTDGSAAFRRVGSLQDAVRLVEHLRNNEAISDLSVHLLTEVPLEIRPYYRVDVASGGAASPAPRIGAGSVQSVDFEPLPRSALGSSTDPPPVEPAAGAEIGFLAS